MSVGLEDFGARFAKVLDSYSVLYNPVSLVESKWVVLRKVRDEPSKREPLLNAYRTGLKVLESDGRLEETRLTGDSVETAADELLANGVRDYFDRVIYGTAAEQGCVLLTEDRELSKLKAREGSKPSRVVSWRGVL